MPFTGGYSPGYERYGGGTPDLQRKVESLATQLGTAYDTSTGVAGAWAQAIARALDEADRNNQRHARQWVATTMTTMLSRWEAIYGIVPYPTDTIPVRQARIRILQGLTGQATQQVLTDALSTLLGSVFVAVVNGNSSTANVWTPSSWPMGQHDASGQIDWFSSVAYVAIQVKEPSGYQDSDFYNAVAGLYPIMDAILPAWVSWDWFRQDIHGSAGFWLDELNLDNEAFDV